MCRGIALLAVMSAGFAHAQEITMSDALSGQTMPLTYKPANVPSDFKAVKITQSGSGQIMGIGAMPTPSGTSATADMFLEILPLSWTNGQTITMAGQQYLVTYGIDLGANTMKSMVNSKKVEPFSLRLRLVKTSEIGSITPMPEWTKTRYMRAMAQIVIDSPTRLAMSTPVLTASTSTQNPSTIPAPMATIPEKSIETSAKMTQTPKAMPSTMKNTPATKSITETPPSNTAVKGISIDRGADAAIYEQGQENAKSVAAAMLVYAQDYDGTFPYVQSSKGADYVIFPYVKSANVYQTMNPVRGGEFRFNMSITGVKMADITDPASTPLFYDPLAWPNGTYLVSFADSHVKFVSSDQWENIKKNLALKLKKNGKPLSADLGLPTTTGTPTTPAATPSTSEGTTIPPTPAGKTGGNN
jgi:hypothetical protein